MTMERVIRAAAESPDPWESRAFPCPDGMIRVVCLQPGCWRTVDHLEWRDGFDVQELVDRCFHLVRPWSDEDPGRDFAYDFAAAIEHEIVVAFHRHIEMPRKGIANESWQCPWWPRRSDGDGSME